MSCDPRNAPKPKLPPKFKLLSDGPDRWLCVNDNSYEEHVSVWHTPEEASSAAWDWWHDVKG
jgi:hypothetical protein